MRRLRISELGFRVGAAMAIVLAAAAARGETPAKTPTPAPRLSGGFGRPRNTPPPTAAPDTNAPAQSAVVAAAKTSSAGAPEKSTVTIDNRSLVKDTSKGRVSTTKSTAAHPVPPPPPPPSPAPISAPSAASASEAAPTSTLPGGGAGAGTETEWKEIAARTRKRVADDKDRVSELTAATKKLENDFYAWDDGQYRDRVIKPAWDRSRMDLETAKQELEAAEKDLSDLPEKARKAGALPGWIRE